MIDIRPVILETLQVLPPKDKLEEAYCPPPNHSQLGMLPVHRVFQMKVRPKLFLIIFGTIIIVTTYNMPDPNVNIDSPFARQY